MRKIICLAALTLLSISPAGARLGETEAQSIARYGPLTESFNPGEQNCSYRTLVFIKDRYITEALFIDGACQMVVFRKADKSEMSADELNTILTANSGGLKWLPSPLISTDRIWDRNDKAMARYDTENHALAVCSAEYLDAEKFRRQAEQKKNLERF